MATTPNPLDLTPTVTLQQLVDVQLNAFAVQLIVESLKKHKDFETWKATHQFYL